MSSAAIATVVKMMESLPEDEQERLVKHLREYIADLQDELRWETLFERTQQQLLAAARRAHQEVAEGHAQPLDPDRL